MARKYIRVLEEKIKAMRKRIEADTATKEEIAWLEKIDAAKQKKPTINLNPGKEKPQKRRKPGRSPGTTHIQRYHHPHSRRG